MHLQCWPVYHVGYRKDLSEVSTEKSWYASHWAIFTGNVPQGPVHSFKCKLMCHWSLIHYDGTAVVDHFGQCCPPLDCTHGCVHSSDIEWKFESGVQCAPPVSNVAAMPLDAVAREMCPCDRTVDKMKFMR